MHPSSDDEADSTLLPVRRRSRLPLHIRFLATSSPLLMLPLFMCVFPLLFALIHLVHWVRFDELDTSAPTVLHDATQDRLNIVLCDALRDRMDEWSFPSIDIDVHDGLDPLRLTVYETRFDRSNQMRHVLFVVDVVDKTGHVMPNSDESIDDYGYYHSSQYGVSARLREWRSRGGVFVCDQVHTAEWEFMDGFFELSCLGYMYDQSFTLSLDADEVEVQLHWPRTPTYDIVACGSVLNDDTYMNDIIPYIEHHAMLGVQHFHVFDRTGMYRETLRPLIDAALVSYHYHPWRDESLGWDKTRIYNDQHVTLEKCKYLTHGTATWVVNTDYDEWLTVPLGVAWYPSVEGPTGWDVRGPDSPLHIPTSLFLSEPNQQLTTDMVSRGSQAEHSSALLKVLRKYATITNSTPATHAYNRTHAYEPAGTSHEPIYDWVLPIPMMIFCGHADANATRMIDRYRHRQAYDRNKWSFKLMVRPNLPRALLNEWSKEYTHRRPYPRPEYDEYTEGESSYMTQHKASYMRYDDLRVPPPTLFAFAHYLDVKKPRQWTQGGECSVFDDSVQYPTRMLDRWRELQGGVSNSGATGDVRFTIGIDSL